VSFIRMGEESSDVYLYDHIERGLTCGFCSMKQTSFGNDVDAMLRHLDRHRAMGHHVPDWVPSRLRYWQRT
jgi:hypothetical protein